MVESTFTPVAGDIVTDVITGSVLSTATESLASSAPPSTSVAVAVQVIVSLGDDVLAVRVRLEDVPKVLKPFVHS
jgi:mannose/fructose/N-acetylgalactosamine-specific phosphotransferase system component IIC